MKPTAPILIAALLSTAACSQALAAHAHAHPHAAPFHITREWKLDRTGGFDYLTMDAPHHLLYIAQGTRIVILDTRTGTVAGTIEGLVHAHGVVLSSDGRTGYLSDGGAGVIRTFDPATRQLTGSIPAGVNPDSFLIEPTTGHLFVFNGTSKTASIIDPATRQAIATLDLPGKPEFSTTDGKGNVFVNIEPTGEMMRLSAAENKITAKWPLAPCEKPTGMAIDIPGNRLFSVCDNARMPVVDAASGRIVATAAIGEGPDAVAYDAKHKLLFASNGDTGTVSVVHQLAHDKYVTLQTIKTHPGARTLAFNPDTNEVYVIAPVGPGDSPATRQLVIVVLGH